MKNKKIKQKEFISLGSGLAIDKSKIVSVWYDRPSKNVEIITTVPEANARVPISSLTVKNIETLRDCFGIDLKGEKL